MKTPFLFLTIALILVTTVARGQTNTPAPATTNTTAQLEAQVASLTKQVGDLSKLLSEFAKANAELASALTNRPVVAPQANVAPRQPTHTWVNGQLVPIGAGGGAPQQTGGVAVNMEHILRNAPGRVVGVTVAPQRLGTPYNAHVSSDGSTFYSLAPGRGN